MLPLTFRQLLLVKHNRFATKIQELCVHAFWRCISSFAIQRVTLPLISCFVIASLEVKAVVLDSFFEIGTREPYILASSILERTCKRPGRLLIQLIWLWCLFISVTGRTNQAFNSQTLSFLRTIIILHNHLLVTKQKTNQAKTVFKG